MVANECECCHEDCCIGKILFGEDFECKSMVATDGGLIECHGDNADLIEGCSECQIRPANAEFPYQELCKECASEIDEAE